MSVIVIAECGNNHEGNINTALELLEKAVDCGVDIVKFQAGTAQGFARRKEDIARYQKYELGRHGYDQLIARARELKSTIMFSVWGDAFEEFRNRYWFKLAARQYSYENINKYACNSGTIVSIPNSLDLETIKSIGVGNATPLHCVSEYPTYDPNLIRIPVLKTLLGKPVGFSDHCLGIKTAVAAVHLFGACAIEKHLTLAHDFGPLRDHALSATPEEMRELVLSVKG